MKCKKCGQDTAKIATGSNGVIIQTHIVCPCGNHEYGKSYETQDIELVKKLEEQRYNQQH